MLKINDFSINYAIFINYSNLMLSELRYMWTNNINKHCNSIDKFEP